MKKIKFSIEVIKIFMKNQTSDKNNILLDMIRMIARCFIVFLLYGYIFKISGGSINGVDYKTTMWSMFIYFAIMILNIRSIDNVIMTEVKSGNVEMFLNKPVNYLTLNYYKVIGKGLFSFLFITLVGTILMVLSLGFPNVNLVVFIPSLLITFLLGQILALLLYGIIGMLAFFIQEVRPVHWIVDKLVMVLGGSYLPVSLFPKYMKLMAFYSPFGAINFATSTVYDSWNSEYLTRIGLQVVWIIIFGLLSIYIYRKTREKAMINGG